jgi:L-iditol 2-dehydrogenase
VIAAVLHGPGDLRVEEVPDPEPGPGEVLVRIERATTCGTDVKMWRRGHPILDGYPARFGHETAGIRQDTGERVLVGDSVACGECREGVRGRPQICRDPRWVLGGFAELIAAPEAALHYAPEGLLASAVAMAEPLAAALHAVRRAPAAAIAPDAGVLGGGPMGLMLAAILVDEGRTVAVADRHAERRAQAQRLGARGVEELSDHDVVFEAVGRPDAWRVAVEACAPGGCVVFVGGCPADSDASLPTHPLHYEELDLRGAFHHSREEVDDALALLARGVLDEALLAAGPIGLDGLPAALAQGNDGPARKWVVDPQLGVEPSALATGGLTPGGQGV